MLRITQDSSQFLERGLEEPIRWVAPGWGAVRGDHGRAAQEPAEAGDFWAGKGVVGGLQEFGSELRDWLW